MNNPILQSESFDLAVYHFRDVVVDRLSPTMDGFSYWVEQFGKHVGEMREQIDRIARIEGMKAENAQRQHLGQSMAYTEQHFNGV